MAGVQILLLAVSPFVYRGFVPWDCDTQIVQEVRLLDPLLRRPELGGSRSALFWTPPFKM